MDQRPASRASSSERKGRTEIGLRAYGCGRCLLCGSCNNPHIIVVPATKGRASDNRFKRRASRRPSSSFWIGTHVERSSFRVGVRSWPVTPRWGRRSIRVVSRASIHSSLVAKRPRCCLTRQHCSAWSFGKPGRVPNTHKAGRFESSSDSGRAIPVIETDS